nr:hypothetical protein CPGR_02551 [Mycolicibacterium malmesburyense]
MQWSYHVSGSKGFSWLMQYLSIMSLRQALSMGSLEYRWRRS